VNISFAHNRLTGTIPKFLLKNAYLELCLSYNKLTGSLDSNDFYNPLPPEAKGRGNKEEDEEEEGGPSRLILALENNRLSGFLPKHLNLIPTLTILQGNLFDCNPKHPLPRNDPKHGDYVCGSQQLDQALILWGCVVAVWAIIFLTILFVTSQNPIAGVRPIPIPNEDLLSSSPIASASKGCSGIAATEATHFLFISPHTPPPVERDLQSSISHWIQNLLHWNHFGKIESLRIVTQQFRIRNLESLKHFLLFLKMIRKIYSSLCLVILFFGLPLYLILKATKSSTHEYQYGWLFSAAYMSGVIPAIMMMIFYSLVACVVGSSFVSLYSMTQIDRKKKEEGDDDDDVSTQSLHTRKMDSPESSSPAQQLHSDQASRIEEARSAGGGGVSDSKPLFSQSQSSSPCSSSSSPSSHRLIQLVVYGALIGINILIYLSANSLYVYLLLSGSKDIYRICAKVGISLFTLSWNMFLLPSLLEYFCHSIQDHFSKFKWILLFLLLFNNIAVPGLATAASDPSCFDDIFIYQNKIAAYYSYVYCEIYSVIPSSLTALGGVWLGTETEAGPWEGALAWGAKEIQSECLKYSVTGVSTSYSPPFFYNFSCASAILENYVPVYFISYSLLALIPLFTFLLFQSPFEISSFLPNSMLLLLVRYIPLLWRAPTSYPFQIQYHPSSKLFKPNRIICNILSHLSVLMTFGLAYPFLALAIVVAVCVVTWYHEMTIGRYLEYRFSLYLTVQSVTRPAAGTIATERDDDDNDLTGGMNSACSDILSGLSTSLWTILIGSSILFSFLIFDFSGDEIARDQALSLAGLACVIPIIFGWLSFKFASHTLRKSEEGTWMKEGAGEYEIIPQLEENEDDADQ
jgi:hypothetical protein